MKLIVILFSILVNLFGSTQNMEKRKITIIVRASFLSDSSQIFISGNHELIGNWHAGRIALTKNAEEWKKEFLFDEGTTIEFKFTLGTWGSEALNDDGTIPSNNILSVENDSILVFNISNWKRDQIPDAKITGKVIYHRKFNSNIVTERDVIVWLPPSYQKQPVLRYPVLYVHDGQNIFDASTSFSGVEWGIDETADSLIRNNEIEEIIIVGIYNTQFRNSEYSYGEAGNKYMDFITKELKPYIDSVYRTFPDRKNTVVIGSSMGGLISLIMVWERTEIFSMAACFSPAFKIDEFDYTPQIKKYSGEKKNIKLFVACGARGIEAELLPGIKTTLDLLKEKSYRKNIEIFIDDNAEHNEKDWSKMVYKALIYFFGKK